MVGRSGAVLERSAVVTARARNLPASTCGQAEGMLSNMYRPVRTTNRHGRGTALVGNMRAIDISYLFAQFARHMSGVDATRGGEFQLARIRLGVVDHFLSDLCRHFGIDH